MSLSISFVYGSRVGIGGLGMQAATALTALAQNGRAVHAFGPGRVPEWSLSNEEPSVGWHQSPEFIPTWALRYSWWRWYQGNFQMERDSRLSRWASVQMQTLQPESCYVFTQVSRDSLKWARQQNVPSVLDSPTGHIRHLREVLIKETRLWFRTKYRGHPTAAMIDRVEEEYQLADRIRVSSDWAKKSIVAYGVPEKKISVIAPQLDLKRFHPRVQPMQSAGPLRVCYIGNLNLAKGFHYLLRAIRKVGVDNVSLEIVGATGNRATRKFFEEECKGLRVRAAPGDPVPAYHRAEVFVLPSLHDGFGFVVAEAMACGLPVIVTEDCGAASWVREGRTGWIVPSASVDALVDALSDAMRRRKELPTMGSVARTDVELLAGPSRLNHLRDWFYRGIKPNGNHSHDN